jgi:hypothetical protein
MRDGSRRARRVVMASALAGFLLGAFLPETFSVFRGVAGAFGVAVLVFHVIDRGERTSEIDHKAAPRAALVRPLALFIALWIGVQAVIPLAHFAIPGNEYWTEEGNRFAWHMLVRVKTARVVFILKDPKTGRTWIEDPRRHLTNYQLSKLDVPDMILQFAHHLEDVYRAAGIDDIEVRVDAKASLNGRRPQRYIRKEVDLTEVRRPYLPPADWIVPLKPYREAKARAKARTRRGSRARR